MYTTGKSYNYNIVRRIGGGSFGEIFMGLGPNKEEVAIKLEPLSSRSPQLRHEYKVYRELFNCSGFCTAYHFGVRDNYNVMVMDLLGLSLEDLFTKCNRRFSLKTVLLITDQLLETVGTLHSRHLIHRDIKPANFVIGTGVNSEKIFCVDFGLSKRFRHPTTLQHISRRDGKSLTGTPRYASINNHLGIEPSRRDDLESIGYVLIYFLKGSLPWQGLKAKTAPKKYKLILEKKQETSIAQLCQGCPPQFAEFLAYTRSLTFEGHPDIAYLRKLFRDLYVKQGYANTPGGKVWDWDNLDLDLAKSPAVGEDIRSSPKAVDPIPLSITFTRVGPLARPSTAGGSGGGGGGHGDREKELFDEMDVGPDMEAQHVSSVFNNPSSSSNAVSTQRPSSSIPAAAQQSQNARARVDIRSSQW